MQTTRPIMTASSRRPWPRGLRFPIATFWAAAFAVLCLGLGAPPAVAKDQGSLGDIQLVRLEGGKVKLSELAGKPVLLDLWATWCIPCRQQREILDQMADTIEQRGVEVFAVNIGEEEALVKTSLSQEPSQFPVLLDESQVLSSKLKVHGLPTLVLLRADGTLAATSAGVTEHDALLALLDRVAAPAAK
ncbi:MAG: TlpA family protein disulfide reductase [Acidobacteria bacterium]|nr:TlpA family protein disulfide reductase [Acidobacteriota bacterium]